MSNASSLISSYKILKESVWEFLATENRFLLLINIWFSITKSKLLNSLFRNVLYLRIDLVDISEIMDFNGFRRMWNLFFHWEAIHL